MNTQLVVPDITDPKTLACLARCRKFLQYCKAVEDALRGVCPFCKVDRDYNQVTMENDSWFTWPCRPPEKFTKHHFLFVPKKHVTGICDLTGAEWLQLAYIMNDVREKYSIMSSGVLIRDGDATLSAGTIQHLHMHMMVPNGTGRVESPFYKGAKSETEGVKRAIIFEEMRRGTTFDQLSPEEQEIVRNRLD